MIKRLLLLLTILCTLPTCYGGTVTGSLQGPSGLPVKNSTLTFQLQQAGLIVGTGNVAQLSTACYTDSSGNVVGLPNPSVLPVASLNLSSGTLPAGIYYVVETWVNAAGAESGVSPELRIQLASTGSLILAVPISVPASATGLRIYVGTTSGGETRQGVQGLTGPFTLGTPLTSGAAPPATNATICSIAFNDQIIPYQGYNVSLVSSTGNAYPGWPQSWQLNGGAAGSINVSQGAPLWNGVVVYPMPILSQPLNHGPQSISGSLNMEGYDLLNVGNFTSASVSTGEVNGVLFPAACAQGASSPPWCSGTTADAWIRAACTQLPGTGGTINLQGLNGTLAASVPCSTPTKQVIILQDPTSELTVTEKDGGITFPLDNGSMLLGPGAGQCIFNYNTGVLGGIHLDPTAVVTAIVGPAHTDGTQQDLTVQGACLEGAAGATVTKGLMYTKATFVNTTFSENVVEICPNACLWVEDVGGIVNISGNELDPTSGVYSISGSGLVLASNGSSGCQDQGINVYAGNIEHANGGANYPEINIIGNGAGAFACGIYIHDIYTEKGNQGNPSTVGIKIQDCWHCAFTNIYGGGGSGTSGDLINISASAAGRISNVTFNNIGNFYGTWTNTINDTTSTGSVLSGASVPFVATYYSNPGYAQPPVLPQSTIQSVGSDVMAGAGNFATGSSTIGTSFETACSTGLTCVYTRTNSTAPAGYTWSQEVQITANADSSEGFNGVEYSPSVSFTAGQTYVFSFWAKGDGSFVGYASALLWNPLIPTFYCNYTAPSALTTAWTLYTATCTPTSSGSAQLQVAAVTPTGHTGAFWLAGFTFAPVQPLSAGSFVTSVSPYGIGTASIGSLGTATIGSGTGAPTSTCGTAPNGSGSLWLRTDSSASTTLYVCSSTTWTAVTIP